MTRGFCPKLDKLLDSVPLIHFRIRSLRICAQSDSTKRLFVMLLSRFGHIVVDFFQTWDCANL